MSLLLGPEASSSPYFFIGAHFATRLLSIWIMDVEVLSVFGGFGDVRILVIIRMSTPVPRAITFYYILLKYREHFLFFFSVICTVFFFLLGRREHCKTAENITITIGRHY